MTGGFNVWNRSVFGKVDVNEIFSTGYCFQIELKYRGGAERLLVDRGPDPVPRQGTGPVQDVAADRAGGHPERPGPAVAAAAIDVVAGGEAWLSC